MNRKKRDKNLIFKVNEDEWNLIQKRLLAAYGLKHDSGYCCNGITQKKKAQRNKQRSKQHAV